MSRVPDAAFGLMSVITICCTALYVGKKQEQAHEKFIYHYNEKMTGILWQLDQINEMNNQKPNKR